ncbi:MAG TPA: THUMP domain-containing protein [Chitinophagales bacterium]|nr:RNA methyltransferase [Chitinophagales bacterium]HMX03191.1 THUMP domain-containing protein [Chitinophagales bacterium]HMZ88985.1 THUMP domain-containing protein [Chitinophagales bacterium]HNA56748.1 THUMP domain-containing protein [Chitinophagales bacterium]HNE46325.1 THUMP domain-containing protein [Chitinophagales bacterium]
MQQRIIVKTFQGFESILASELFALGATDVEVLNRAVQFKGDKALLYAANIHLRTGLKVMIPLLEGRARNEQQLYDLVKQFDWGDVMRVDDTFSISQAIYSRFFPHGNYAALKIKDAIADHFRDAFGMRPSVDRDNAVIQLHVHIAEDQIQISLDSSGDSLHLRGYRTGTHAAPMSEVQAAGLILLSGWDQKTTFYDPMCGSGTMPIEAALIAANVAPGLIRKHFAFQRWHDYDTALYRQLILDAAAKVKRNKLHVLGSDINGRNVDLAQAHAIAALPDMKIPFFKKDFQLADPPPEKGVVIMNPPYGERLQHADMIAFYQMIGNVLKQKYAGWTAWVFTGNLEAAKFIGLKPSEKYKLKNGPLDALFLRFDIREGKFWKGQG